MFTLKSTAYSADDDIYYNSPLLQKDALLTFRAFDDFLEQPAVYLLRPIFTL